MKTRKACLIWVLGWMFAGPFARLDGALVFETTSPYHHIRVIDQQGERTLYFDASIETRMSLLDSLKGHCEYTEYFHLVWLWRTNLTNVLMIGLGGASVQRAFQHDYPAVIFETAELDPVVAEVAQKFFYLRESPKLKVHLADGRVFLRRSTRKYDAIFLDAYTANRYGSFVPYALATKEFFALAKDHLTPDGVLAYNVIGDVDGPRTSLLGDLCRTLNTVFPQVHLFPVVSSRNVILFATQSAGKLTLPDLQRRADELVKSGRVSLPTFRTRLQRLRLDPPANAARSRILTDDFAPIDNLLSTGD